MNKDNGALYDFSDIYLMLPGRFVAPKAAVGDFDPTKLDGKTVAVRKGSTHAAFIQRYLKTVKLAEFASEADALQSLKNGKADVYFGDAMRASFWLNQNPDCCAFAGEPYFRPDLFGDGLAVAVAPGHETVREAIDYSLVRLKRAGTLDDLYLRWFPVGFY